MTEDKSLNEQKAEKILDYLMEEVEEVEDGDFDAEDFVELIDRDDPYGSAERIMDYVSKYYNDDFDYDEEVKDGIAKIVRKKRLSQG